MIFFSYHIEIDTHQLYVGDNHDQHNALYS